MTEAVDAGHCAELGLDGDTVGAVLGALAFYFPLRDLMPALVHRLERCDTPDVDAVSSLLSALYGLELPGNDGAGASDVLFFHVALSEMWYAPDDAPTQDEVVAAFHALTVSTGLETWLAARLSEWPTYPRDAFDDVVPAYDGPLLMLQGGLDPATPWEQAAALAESFDGPAQTWAFFPYGAHGVVYGSPAPAGDCGLDVYLQFLDEPRAALDLDCIDDVLPPEFDGDPAINAWLLGTSDAWGDDP